MTTSPTNEASDIDNREIRPRLNRRAVAAAIMGNAVEYYDFSIYGYLSATLAIVFFPSTDATTALLATFATFAVAFALRPVGGLLFGHFGDRVGRKKILMTTIALMTVATFLIGLLPTYAAIGTGAAALLVLARCVQGISAGGELPGAGTYLNEIAPPGRRAFTVSFTQFGAFLGGILASLLITGMNSLLSHEQMISWGWRIPFMLALPLGMIGLYIRTKLEDTTEFKEIAARGEVVKIPAVEILRHHRLALLQTIGLCALALSSFYITYVYMAIYISGPGGQSTSFAFWSMTTTLAVSCAFMPFFGILADKTSCRLVLLVAAAAYLVFTIPLFTLIQSGGAASVLGHIALGIMASAVNAVTMPAFTEMFPAKVRQSAVGLGLNVSSALIGGTSPFVATWLIKETGNPGSPAYWLIATAVITLLTALTLRKERTLTA